MFVEKPLYNNTTYSFQFQYNIFLKYTTLNIYTNQKKVQNYNSYNIKTNPMTFLTYTTRCTKNTSNCRLCLHVPMGETEG